MTTRNIDRLLNIMARLRDPEEGCPWDVEQTSKSIARYTVEEAYEVADAIERDDRAAMREELGDLLLQVVFHARMAEEEKSFDFEDVAVLIDSLSYTYLEGSKIDYTQGLEGARFIIDNPNATTTCGCGSSFSI